MSLPNLPDPALTREEAINQIIASIAMEEVGLSHIINAEGEKLQYALGTIPGVSGPPAAPTIEDLLALNSSVHKTLDSAMLNQIFLKEKMANALSASTMQGPTGAPGAMTTILGSYATPELLRQAHPTGTAGDAYLVGRELYVWDPTLDDWNSTGDLAGPTGPSGASAYEDAVSQGYTGTLAQWLDSLIGPTGPVGAILGHLPTVDDLPANPAPGDTYLVGQGELYAWINGEWVSSGSLLGPTGPAGATGPTGATGPEGDNIGTIAGVVPTEAELPDTGSEGELLIVSDYQGTGEPHLFVWNNVITDWQHVGMFEGVIGPTGPTGTFDTGTSLFSVTHDGGQTATVMYGDPLSFTSSTLDIEVTGNPASVRVDHPGQILQFNAITPARMQSLGEQRSTIVLVGLGRIQLISASDPIVSDETALSIKLLTGGTITRVQYSLSLSLAATDLALSTVHACIYMAGTPESQEFTYLEDSEATFTIPYGAAVGSLFSRSVELSRPVTSGCQLMLVFYNTTVPMTTSGIEGIMSGAVLLQ